MEKEKIFYGNRNWKNEVKKLLQPQILNQTLNIFQLRRRVIAWLVSRLHRRDRNSPKFIRLAHFIRIFAVTLGVYRKKIIIKNRWRAFALLRRLALFSGMQGPFRMKNRKAHKRRSISNDDNRPPPHRGFRVWPAPRTLLPRPYYMLSLWTWCSGCQSADLWIQTKHIRICACNCLLFYTSGKTMSETLVVLPVSVCSGSRIPSSTIQG